MIDDYEAQLPFAPLTSRECLLRYGSAAFRQGHSYLAERQQHDADRDALHWRLFLELKQVSS